MLNLNYNYVYFHTFIQDITQVGIDLNFPTNLLFRFHSAAAPSAREQLAGNIARRQFTATRAQPPAAADWLFNCAVTASSTACAMALAATLTSFVCGSVVISLILLPGTAKHRSPAHPPGYCPPAPSTPPSPPAPPSAGRAAGAVLPHRVVVRLFHHRRIVRRFTALLAAPWPAPAPPGLSAPSAGRYRPACG